MLVKLKQKGQITIPALLRERIAAVQGDVFDIDIVDGKIVLNPQGVVSRKSNIDEHKPSDFFVKRKPVDISQWIGSGKGLFETVEDVDTFIRHERAQWD